MSSAYSLGSRGSVLVIVTKLRAGRSGVRMSVRAEIFLFSKTSRPAFGPTQPPIQWVPGAFSGVKRPGFEGNYFAPCIAEVKNEWNCTSPPPVSLHFTDSDTVTFTIQRSCY
jgi:hypothetical protein